MVFEFRLPDVGEGIDAAEIVHWYVAVGDQVREDQPLVDIQTDKAIVELPVPTDGVVRQLCGEIGDSIKVGEVLAAFDSTSHTTNPSASADITVAADESTPDTTPTASPTTSPGLPPQLSSAKALASPAVRKAALSRGIDISQVSASGPGNRILLEDVLSFSSKPEPSNDPVRTGGFQPTMSRESTTEPLRGVRRVIAKNMTVAWQTIPHIIDYREIDATALLAARMQLRARAEARGDAEMASLMTMLPILAKIAATIARRHPRINSAVDMEREVIIVHSAVNLSIPVNGPDGLMTPVIRDADLMSITQIAIAIGQLTSAARSRSLKVNQLSGGTITVNNFGALGSPFSTPIIPPGQTVNIGFGRVEERAVVRNGEIVIRPILGLSCSGDHRLLDGVDLAGFVNDLIEAVESPILLLSDLA